MFGHLVPCSGGKSVDLSRTNVYLGRRPDADREAPLGAQTALCRLRFVDGWWHVDNLSAHGDIRINHERCHSRRLDRLDELAIGRARFRIDYFPPGDASVFEQDELEEIAESVLFSQSNLGLLRSPPPVSAPPPVSVAAVRPEGTPPIPRSRPAVPSTTTTSADNPSPPNELLGRLVPLGGGPDHPLMNPKVTVGRQPPCDIVLRVGTVSSKHCTLELNEGYWQVKDLGSRNGVRLDSVRCDQAWVFPESRLSIADQRFRLDYTPDGEPPVPNPSQRPSLMAQAGLVGEELDRLMSKQARPGTDADSERKRFELLEDV
ncbi:MAG: FHA domain-containing protein [Planctomycetaceae bacterium]|nr:FHA domain-containing protein [Planctomycetaceae bacterium]